jgi:hypothetical protein
LAKRNKKPRTGWLKKGIPMADATKKKFFRIPADIPMIDPETDEPISDNGLTEKVHATAVADLERFVSAGAVDGADAKAKQTATNAAAELRKLVAWCRWVFRWRTYVFRLVHNHDGFAKDADAQMRADDAKSAFLHPAGTIVDPDADLLALFAAAAKDAPKDLGGGRTILGLSRPMALQTLPFYRAVTASAFVKDTRTELEPPPAAPPSPAVQPVPQSTTNGAISGDVTRAA